MQHQLTQLWDFHPWTIIAAGSALVMVTSIVADRRRTRRTQFDNVGFMPWTAISIMATLTTVLSIALALKSG